MLRRCFAPQLRLRALPRHSTQRGHKALGRHSFADYKAASSTGIQTGIQKLQFSQLYSETH